MDYYPQYYAATGNPIASFVAKSNSQATSWSYVYIISIRFMSVHSSSLSCFLSLRFLVPSLTIPLLATLLIFGAQVIHIVVSHTTKSQNASLDAAAEDDQPVGTQGATRGWVQRRVDDIGGLHIFFFVAARLVGCLTLFGLSLVTLFASTEQEETPFLPPLRKVLTEWSPISIPITFVSMRRFYI